MIIGITGSFGSGKTTVASLFRKYGFKVINVDKLYYGLYKENASLKAKLKKEFGTINRARIKKIVFNNYKKLKELNKITHPLIINEVKKEIEDIIKNKSLKNKKNMIMDAPLLLEAKSQNLVDKVIVVKCSKKTQIKRILKKKKKYSKNEIENIIKSQMPLRQKLRYADFIVDNSFSLKNTRGQVKEIIKELK